MNISLTPGATAEELQHLEDMKDGILAVMDGETWHGSFVTLMAEKDFEWAFRYADNINRVYFGALMEWRLYVAELL